MNNSTKNSRRKFLNNLGGASLGIAALGLSASSAKSKDFSKSIIDPGITTAGELFFNISLAEWSLNRDLFGGKMTNMEFPERTKRDFGIEAVEYVNQFFKDKAEDQEYLSELKTRCSDLGVKSLLIMCDGEGNLGDLDEVRRLKAVENHYKWIDAAKFLGCHSIRVNAAGNGTSAEVSAAAIQGLGELSEYGAKEEINVIVENHGGFSSDGKWLSNVISQVGMDNCGTLPDFGNFCIKRTREGCEDEYDRYQGMKDLMPFAKGVSAKSHVFDENGNEVNTDFKQVLQIVKESGFKGYIGIEYEGRELAAPYGIMATKWLLEKVGKELG